MSLIMPYLAYVRNIEPCKKCSIFDLQREKRTLAFECSRQKANKQIRSTQNTVGMWTRLLNTSKFKIVRHCGKLSGFVELLRQRFQPHQQQQQQQHHYILYICLAYESYMDNMIKIDKKQSRRENKAAAYNESNIGATKTHRFIVKKMSFELNFKVNFNRF